MRPVSVETLEILLGGRRFDVELSQVYGFATDTRDVRPGDAFLAIQGARVDGHDFVAEAYENGAVVAIVERHVDGPHILVENLVAALAHFGETIRDSFDGPVIGITGSAGKTTTKEFVAAGLKPLGKILKTTGNRNTEYTSPLLWGDLETDTKAVVVEMAMRGFGQIAHLAAFTKPMIGVITNIGYGHLEQVGSRDGIAKAKGELLEALPETGVAVLWAEDEYLGSLREMAGSRTVRTFGFSEEADCRITEYRSTGARCMIAGVLDGASWQADLPAVGRHIAINASAAILACSLCGVDAQLAADQFQDAQLPKMRMEVRDFRGASLLLDTYNASPPAMIAAIETLLDMPVMGRRFAVIGEMKELGDQTEALHREIGKELAALDSVIFFGEPMTRYAREAAIASGLKDARVASTIEEVVEFLNGVGPGDVVLMKGSRALELERALED